MQKQAYDHRIKEMVVALHDPTLFQHLGVNAATAKNWLYRGYNKPIAVDEESAFQLKKNKEIESLKKQLAQANALIGLYNDVAAVCALSLRGKNIRCRDTRRAIIAAIGKATKIIPISRATHFLGISCSRYKRWQAANRTCLLSSNNTCIKQQPNQLSFDEVKVMKNLVTSKKYAHMTISSLHLYAKRQELLHCCPDTWYKYIDRHSWQRPHAKQAEKTFSDRVKRATAPNEILHIDITHIKTKSGQTYYLQTILDNYSRYILAWKLHRTPLASNTASLLNEAFLVADSVGYPQLKKLSLVSDQGTENLNKTVKTLINRSAFTHRLHRAHIRFSNNMLEVFFRSLKNNYLNYLPAKSKEQLIRRLRFYINEHNNHVPLKALDGATPSEKYHHTWTPPPLYERQHQSKRAQRQRIETNKQSSCGVCRKN